MPLGESLKVHSELLAEEAGKQSRAPLSVSRCEVSAPRPRSWTLTYRKV